MISPSLRIVLIAFALAHAPLLGCKRATPSASPDAGVAGVAAPSASTAPAALPAHERAATPVLVPIAGVATQGATASANVLDWSIAGTLACAHGSAVSIFDGKTGAFVQRSLFPNEVTQIEYTPDGRKLIALTSQGELFALDVATNHLRRLATEAPTATFRFMPEGATLITSERAHDAHGAPTSPTRIRAWATDTLTDRVVWTGTRNESPKYELRGSGLLAVLDGGTLTVLDVDHATPTSPIGEALVVAEGAPATKWMSPKKEWLTRCQGAKGASVSAFTISRDGTRVAYAADSRDPALKDSASICVVDRGARQLLAVLDEAHFPPAVGQGEIGYMRPTEGLKLGELTAAGEGLFVDHLDRTQVLEIATRRFRGNYGVFVHAKAIDAQSTLLEHGAITYHERAGSDVVSSFVLLGADLRGAPLKKADLAKVGRAWFGTTDARAGELSAFAAASDGKGNLRVFNRATGATLWQTPRTPVAGRLSFATHADALAWRTPEGTLAWPLRGGTDDAGDDDGGGAAPKPARASSPRGTFVAPDRKATIVVVKGKPTTYRVLDETGQLLRALDSPLDAPIGDEPTFRPGTHAYVAGVPSNVGQLRVVGLVDALTGTTVTSVDAQPGWNVTSVAFSVDGARLALIGNESASLWDAATGKRLSPEDFVFVQPHGGPEVETSARFSNVGHLVAVNDVPEGAQLELAVWDVDTGTRLWGTPETSEIVAFSPNDGVLAAVTTADARLRLYDARDGTKLATLVVAPGGGATYAVFAEGTLEVFGAKPPEETFACRLGLRLAPFAECTPILAPAGTLAKRVGPKL